MAGIANTDFRYILQIMFYDFRWTAWNIDKVESHGLAVADVEFVINNARRPYPKSIRNEKWMVVGPTRNGTVIQVIYLTDPDDTLFVIHGRPLTPNERHRRRR
jgi:uncharacterized DUF497 family protein